MTSETAVRNQLVAVFGRIAAGVRLPVLTGVVFAVTAACGIAQLVRPGLFDLVVRDAARIDSGEWYRLVTGMFFQDGRLLGLLSNLVWLAVFGTVAERVFGRVRWVAVYFGCGLFGQVMSYLWLNPVGAGNSMCVAGLLGALAVAILRARRYGVEAPVRLRLLAWLLPVLAVADTVLHDNHGLPALLGMLVGLWLLPTPASSPVSARTSRLAG
jgi:rhomboid protease GluP